MWTLVLSNGKSLALDISSLWKSHIQWVSPLEAPGETTDFLPSSFKGNFFGCPGLSHDLGEFFPFLAVLSQQQKSVAPRQQQKPGTKNSDLAEPPLPSLACAVESLTLLLSKMKVTTPPTWVVNEIMYPTWLALGLACSRYQMEVIF